MAFFEDIERLTTLNCTKLVDQLQKGSRERRLSSLRKALG